MRIPFRRESPQEESLARETLHIQTMLDSLDDELTTDDIVTREKALDKELIILIQGACKSNNIPRAIELAKLSHYTSALDAAIKLADFYRLVGLKEKIMMIKSEREEAEDRLILARNKRRRWLKPEPPLRQLAESSTSASRFDPLGDVRPPPAIERPGMARVTVPIIETTRYSSLAPTPIPHTTSLALESATWDNSQLMESPPPTESKRKHAEIEDPFPSSDFSMPPPKQKTNPFARKTNPDSSKNPFARKSEPNKTIQKSESFFDKVDAAESEPTHRKRQSNAKAKEKKDGPKQATLFGMLPKSEKPPKVTKKPEPERLLVAQESQPESQMSDVTMADVESQDTQIETQETQEVLSSDWETQIVESAPVVLSSEL